MFRFKLVLLSFFFVVPLVSANDPNDALVSEWEFANEMKPGVWVSLCHLENVSVEQSRVFRGTINGIDPFIGITGIEVSVGPFQYAEFQLKTNASGKGELFYSSDPEPGYSGFTQAKSLAWTALDDGQWHTYRLYPDWAKEGTIRKLRLDFPPLVTGGADKPFVEIRAFRVVTPTLKPSEAMTPDWDFSHSTQGWTTFSEDGSLWMESKVFLLSLETNQPWISMELACDQLQAGRFEWITEEGGMGSFDFPVIPDGEFNWYNIDTSKARKPITGKRHLFRFSLLPSRDADGRVTVKRLVISDSPQGPARVVLDHLWFPEPINREGQPTPLSLRLTNRGGATAGDLRIQLLFPVGGKIISPEGWEKIPAIKPMQTIVYTVNALFDQPQTYYVVLRFEGNGASQGDYLISTNILPELKLPRAEYVPEPKPVESDYELGAFYFPGWAKADQWNKIIVSHPERKPVLGWYDEGNPEVIDWQIKWAVENGLKFFLVDWYWSRGRQQLDHWVKGFQNARYKSHLKWAMMWANHNGPGSHSEEDQVKVTQFWIDNYFNTPEYYTIDGKPVVMIWTPEGMDNDIIHIERNKGNSLKKGEGVRKLLDLSRKMAREVGFEGIYFIAMKWPEASTDAKDIQWLADAGFDMTSIYHFMHHGGKAKNPMRFPFDLVVDANKLQWEGLQDTGILPFLPNISTGWDSRPWHGDEQVIIENRTTGGFRTICEDFVKFSSQTGIKRAILGPLNEWGEGSYSEPNLEHGFSMYETLREVFCKEPAGGWPVNYAPGDVGLGPYDLPVDSPGK